MQCINVTTSLLTNSVCLFYTGLYSKAKVKAEADQSRTCRENARLAA